MKKKIPIFNYDKLKGRAKEKHYTQEKMAEKLGIDKSTLSLRLNCKSIFGQDEINEMIKFLDIPGEEIKAYFFTEEV